MDRLIYGKRLETCFCLQDGAVSLAVDQPMDRLICGKILETCFCLQDGAVSVGRLTDGSANLW